MPTHPCDVVIVQLSVRQEVPPDLAYQAITQSCDPGKPETSTEMLYQSVPLRAQAARRTPSTAAAKEHMQFLETLPVLMRIVRPTLLTGHSRITARREM